MWNGYKRWQSININLIFPLFLKFFIYIVHWVFSPVISRMPISFIKYKHRYKLYSKCTFHSLPSLLIVLFTNWIYIFINVDTTYFFDPNRMKWVQMINQYVWFLQATGTLFQIFVNIYLTFMYRWCILHIFCWVNVFFSGSVHPIEPLSGRRIWNFVSEYFRLFRFEWRLEKRFETNFSRLSKNFPQVFHSPIDEKSFEMRRNTLLKKNPLEISFFS